MKKRDEIGLTIQASFAKELIGAIFISNEAESDLEKILRLYSMASYESAKNLLDKI